MEKNHIQLFENQTIRTAWDEEKEEWYFSVVDVCQALTASKDANAYWRKLKQRLKEEGNEPVTNCHRLKMTAADGKKTSYRRCRYRTIVTHYSVYPVSQSRTI